MPWACPVLALCVDIFCIPLHPSESDFLFPGSCRQHPFSKKLDLLADADSLSNIYLWKPFYSQNCSEAGHPFLLLVHMMQILMGKLNIISKELQFTSPINGNVAATKPFTMSKFVFFAQLVIV